MGGRWQVIGRSVRGASHLRSGLPNQDAIRWLPRSGAELPLAVAVADGHGSGECFRSETGSRLAVRVATLALHAWWARSAGPAGLRDAAAEALSRELVGRWRRGVDAHLRRRPFQEAERRRVEAQGRGVWKEIAANPYLAYGATLVALLIAEPATLFLQLGDGDILRVGGDGRVARPLPRDERLLGNETTSLCTQEAWRHVRVRLDDGADDPALIVLATDGYANSFRDDREFLRVGPDLLQMIRADGLAGVDASLEGWLNETSAAGSGDDITVGIACRDQGAP